MFEEQPLSTLPWFEPPAERQGFLHGLLDALYGPPGELARFRHTPERAELMRRWAQDPAVFWGHLVQGYVAGHRKGFKAAADAWADTALSLLVLGLTANRLGEKVSRELAESFLARSQQGGLRSATLEKLGQRAAAKIEAWLQEMARATLAGDPFAVGRTLRAIEAAILRVTEDERRRLLDSPSPYALGEEIGSLAGRAFADIAVEVMFGFALQSAVSKVLKQTLPELADAIRTTSAKSPTADKLAKEAKADLKAIEEAAATELKTGSKVPKPEPGGSGSFWLALSKVPAPLAAKLTDFYERYKRLANRMAPHGELKKEVADFNRLVHEIEDLISASPDKGLRELVWQGDYQELIFESHHVIEARIIRDAKLLHPDVREFFRFIGWLDEDDMDAIPLSRVMHTRTPGKAFKYLDTAPEFQPIGKPLKTGQVLLEGDYTTFSRELITTIGKPAAFSSPEDLLERYKRFYKAAHVRDPKGRPVLGGLWPRVEPLLTKLEAQLREFRKTQKGLKQK